VAERNPYFWKVDTAGNQLPYIDRYIVEIVADSEVLVLKGVHRSGSRGYVDLVVAPLDEPGSMRAESTPLLGLDAAGLERVAREAGATRVQLLGGYDEEPYEPETSPDLILLATK